MSEINTESDSAAGQAKRGGQPRNRNAMTHGRRLAIGNLPSGCGWIKTLCAQFRRSIEQTLESQGRTITAYEAALIQSAVRWEQCCLLCQKQLRLCKPGDPMIYDHSKEIARLTDSRDRVLDKLCLQKSEATPGGSALPWMATHAVASANHKQP